MQIETPKERNLFFSSQFDQKTIMEISKAIVDINENDDYLEKVYAINDAKIERKPIKLFIDSYGGSCYQCFGLVGIIENSKTKIHTIATGAAMSCGYMLLIAGHKRFAYQHATIMYHQISNSFDGKLQDMKEDMKETERVQDILEALTLRKTKITKKQLTKNRNRKIDWFMTSSEAVSLGVIDAIL